MRPLSQTLQCCLKLGRALSVALILGLPLNSGLAASGTDGQSCADASAKPSSEELFERLGGLEDTLIGLEGRYALLPAKMVEEHQLERVQMRLAKHRAELSQLLEQLMSDEFPENLPKAIRDLAYDVEHDREALDLWNGRADLKPFSEIITHPRWLMYGRKYQVKSERGDMLNVRFSKSLVEQFYWEGKDSARKEAAHSSLVGIGRGMRPSTSNAAGGIDFLKEVDGYRVFKIQIVGKQVGAYRVYGCLMNGVFEFVLWEHEGTHDDRYISRVTQKTADICKRL
jgi:hypothetical protein